MSRELIKHRMKKGLYVDPQSRQQLDAWLLIELTDAFASRSALEAEWREDLRMYEGIPTQVVKNFPIPNAPNIEVTIGAVAADSLFAQAIDLVFSTSPLVTCRPIPKFKDDKETTAAAKAMQRFLNYIADVEAKIRVPVEEMALDDTQLGTGIIYIPFVERIKKTKVAKVIDQGPRLICMPPEDVIPFGGSVDEPNLALRFWLTKGELTTRSVRYNWDISKFAPAGNVDWVRSRRETLGQQSKSLQRKGDIYDVFDIFCRYDIDGDGLEEDLYVVYSMTGQASAYIGYNPYDRDPIEKAVYQRRAHLWYGLGVLQMIRPFQRELSDVHNYQTLNMLLANTRLWKGKEGSIPDNMEIWPGKVVSLRDIGDLDGIPMADIYNSIFQAQIMIIQLAEKRVGVNELSNPRASAVMGNRTPGITALSLLQQVNKRFTTAFDGMRLCVSNSIKQCAYRYQEAILRGDAGAVRHIIQVLGMEDGQLVLKLLSDEGFDENIITELTASSASVNRESDRQNAMLLVNILSTYYQRTMELVMLAANPQTPEPVRDIARKIAESAGEVIDRTIRTFDQVRDPAAFIIDINNELDQIQAGPAQLQQLMTMLQGGMGGGGGAPLQPAGPPMLPEGGMPA